MDEPDKKVKFLDKVNPLWMPSGSIRAILAMSIVGTFMYVCVSTGNTEALAAIAVMVAKDYFQSREQ